MKTLVATILLGLLIASALSIILYDIEIEKQIKKQKKCA